MDLTLIDYGWYSDCPEDGREQNGPIVDNSTINGTVDEASIAMN